MTALSFEGLQALSHDTAALAGDLTHLRTRTQREAHEQWLGSADRVFLVDCSRRWGKSWEAAFKTFETIQNVPRLYGRKAIVRYCAPTKLAGRQFVMPVFDAVSSMVPESMRPRFDARDVCWRWPNGGICYLGSAESMGDAEAQVGTSCDLAVCDEAGKYPMGILSHLIKSVYGWQFATTPNGRIFIPSTPPLTPAHDLKGIRDRCFQSGAYARYTIDQCDHISKADREQIVKDIFEQEGGETAVQREAYCEYVTDETMAIIPEMRHATTVQTIGGLTIPSIVETLTRPQFFDCYVIGDFGFNDLTIILFAYYDFKRALLCVEDELVFKGKSGIDVARGTMKKRAELWGLDKRPVAQMADTTLQVIADMAEATRNDLVAGKSGHCVFGAVEKTDADAALNTARAMISERRVRVDPRCRVLLDHLANGVWATGAKTTFARSAAFGHFDAIDAFKYLVRHVDWRRNPTPALHGLDPSTHHIPARIAARDQIQPLVRRDRRL
jgi:hypothetical protein